MFANLHWARLRGLLLAGLIAVTPLSILQSVCAQSGVANQWTWMGGSSSAISGDAEPGIYGTLGTPSADNIPGGREGAASWTDSSGNLWLFGGLGYDANGTIGYLNDLWEFNLSTGQWAWKSGSSAAPPSNGGLSGQPGVYGALGTMTSGNVPGGRYDAASWTDSSGNLWLFGGDGSDQGCVGCLFNDLWKFDTSTGQWAWMGGSSPATCTTNGVACVWPGVYGTMGVPAAGNVPGSRAWGSSWTDRDGNFWLFGGNGLDSAGTEGALNDLWEFNPSSGQWAWMSGSSTASAGNSGQPGVYGTLGTPAARNIPGGRDSASSWTDGSGHLWLFGGDGYDANAHFGALNDLWQFDPSTREWAWMNGSSTVVSSSSNYGQPGVYGTLGTPAAGNVPGGRYEAASWTDGSGNLWLFGGWGYDANGNDYLLNDLWEFGPATSEWAWMGGDSTFITETTPTSTELLGWPGVYGTLETPAPANIPGGRSNVASWTDQGGDFWLFGGYGLVANVPGEANDFNDLWRYQSATTHSFPTVATPTFNVAAGTYTAVQTVTISDTTPDATIFYTTDGTAPTLSSAIYTSPLTVSTVSTTETVEAMAVAANYFNSAVVSATYNIDLPENWYTLTTIASSLNPSNAGEYVTFTATVYPVSSSAVPAGTVQFSQGASPLGPLAALNSSGVATYTTAAVYACGASITAAYIPASGSSFIASTSAPLQQMVAGAPAGESSTTLSSSQNPSNPGQSVTFTATVAGVPPFTNLLCGGGPPAGSGTYAPTGIYGVVQFYANGTGIGSPIQLPGGSDTGVATYSTSALPAGTNAVTAQFIEGNGYVESSTSNTVNQVVNGASNPSFSIAPSSAALSITQGASGADTIAVIGAGGFSGSVTLSASGLPAGVTASFGANPTTATSVLTLAASTAAPGVYSLTVTGTSSATSESAATTVQFAVDSAGAAAPPFGASAATVAAGDTALYPVTLPSDVTGASVACMSLPAGASCSFSSSTNSVTIATSSTTPAGTYQVTMVFTETVAGTASTGILLPIALLPLLLLRRRPAARGIWSAFCLGLILLAATVFSTGCSGAGSTPNSSQSTYLVTSSATVSLTVQ